MTKSSEEIFDELVSIRRKLHQIPERGFEEVKTSRFLQETLAGWGIEFRHGIAGTGIIAYIESDPGKKTIGLRADMDALPVEEKTELDFSSKHEGYFHACGHDMHMTCLLGALKILNDRKESLPVNVKAIFQPAEEVLPGGAAVVIKEGFLKNPDVVAVFGLHVDPFLPTGSIAVKAGPMMASTAGFKITIKGKGGHAAKPFKCIDPIPIAAQVITSLQTISSRMIDPLTPVVISVTKIRAGTTHNVIADNVTLEGTARSLDKSSAQSIPEKMEQLIKGIVSGYNAGYEFDYNHGTAVLVNDGKMTEHVLSVGEKILGSKGVTEYEGTFGGEDFAEYLLHVPGSFFRLGCSVEGVEPVSLHNPTFSPNEQSLIHGSEMLAGIALDFNPGV